jgi:hypothetical protein
LNQKVKRIGGTHRPPREGLIGRTDVGRLLQCDRRTVRRYERIGLLIPAAVQPNGVRWFDIEVVRRMALTFKRSRRGRSRPVTGPAPDAVPTGDYYPELRSRRRSSSPEPPKTAPAKAQVAAERQPSREPRVIRPGARLPSEWWPADSAPHGSAPTSEGDTTSASEPADDEDDE